MIIPPELQSFGSALGGFVLWALLQPLAAGVVGGAVGGFALGASRNRTAFAEIARGLFFGVVAGVLVWLLQAAFGGVQ